MALMRIPDLVTVALVAPLAVTVHLAASSPQLDARVGEILAAAREALGGQTALDKVQTLSVTATTRRVMGEREMSGDVTVELMLPDKMRRTDSFGILGGPTMERVSVLNGSEVWDDSTNRGGGGFMMRMGGPGGAPGGPGGPGGRELTDEDRQRMREAQVRRMKGDMARFALGFLLRTDATITYAGVAEAEDGKADVLEITPAGGTPMKLFIDQETRLPLMLSYEGILPRMMVARGGPPSPEEIEKMRREPPQTATFEVRYGEYKKVDGVAFPHLLTTAANGNVTEEWTVDKIKVNPSLKPDAFAKKGS
jgi:hypothetical protein